MSYVTFKQTTPVAKKIHYCDACNCLNEAWNRADLNAMTFAEKRAYITAEKNNFMIWPGERYIRQPYVYDGDFGTFTGIPAIVDICNKYDLFGEY